MQRSLFCSKGHILSVLLCCKLAHKWDLCLTAVKNVKAKQWQILKHLITKTII